MIIKSRGHSRLVLATWHWLKAFGLDGAVFILALRGLVPYLKDYLAIRRQIRCLGDIWPVRASFPCLQDRHAQSGTASGHYFHQDLLVARRIFERKPKRHFDVGSHVGGFVAHVAVFREVEVLDIRPLKNTTANIIFRQCDLMEQSVELEEACDSLSCLHALEHFGLGRYSDPIDILGHEKGLAGLARLLQPGGTLYLSVPIGIQRIEFNAHRVFAIKTVWQLLQPSFEVYAFSYVDDSGILHQNVVLDSAAFANDLGLQYGCGIFECRKRSAIIL